MKNGATGAVGWRGTDEIKAMGTYSYARDERTRNMRPDVPCAFTSRVCDCICTSCTCNLFACLPPHQARIIMIH